MTHEEAFALFQDAARRIWRNADFVLPHVSLSQEPPSGNVLASLAYANRPIAIGHSLLRRADHYTLRVSDRLLAMPPEHARMVMVHEAVHLGWPNHGIEFRHLVREHGGTVSEKSIENPGTQLQMKVGSRYKTIATFTDEREAQIAAKTMHAQYPEKKLRLSIGGLHKT